MAKVVVGKNENRQQWFARRAYPNPLKGECKNPPSAALPPAHSAKPLSRNPKVFQMSSPGYRGVMWHLGLAPTAQQRKDVSRKDAAFATKKREHGPELQAALIMGLIVIGYTAMGGLEAVVYTERRGQLLRHTDGQVIAAMSAHNLYSGRQPVWGQSYRYLRHRQLHHVEQRRVPGHMGAKRQWCHCMEQRTASSEQRRSTAQHSREVERTEQR